MTKIWFRFLVVNVLIYRLKYKKKLQKNENFYAKPDFEKIDFVFIGVGNSKINDGRDLTF